MHKGLKLKAMMRPAATAAIAMLAVLGLSACERDAASRASQEEATPVFSTGPGGPAYELQPMTTDDLEGAEIEGELACAFAINPAAEPLLLARGFVDAPVSKAQMLVKYADLVVQGNASEEGGYDAMVGGASFDTAAMVIEVAIVGDEVEDTKGFTESAPRKAMIRVSQAGHEQTMVEGYWTCGP